MALAFPSLKPKQLSFEAVTDTFGGVTLITGMARILVAVQLESGSKAVRVMEPS